MTRTFKKWIALLSTTLCMIQVAKAQTTIQISFENGVLNDAKTSYSFDIRAIRGQNYDVANPDSSDWQFMNIRADVEIPVGITITTTGYVHNNTYSSGGGISKNPPGNPPSVGNWTDISANLTRTQQNEIPDGAGAVLGTATINFSAPVTSTKKIVIRPYDGTQFKSFWTNLELTLARKRIIPAGNLVLPVSLIDFSAAREGQVATLAWSTSEETNSDYFEIQRSVDGKDWGKLLSVSAKGESSVEAQYSAMDENPMNGNNFYRLKMVDKDGTFAFSQIRNLKFEKKEGFTLFPNPVSDKLNFKTTEDWKTITSIKLYNAQGVEVYTSPLVPEMEVNVKNLPAGLYVAKLATRNGHSKAYRITIAR